MAEIRIVAEPRTEFGKGGARRTRRAGWLPAVLYGRGAEPRHLSLPARDFAHALRSGANVLLRVELNGRSDLALPKAVQRDPVRGVIEHVDLLLVRRGEKVRVEVPVQIVGEAPPDALVDQQLTTLTVEAEATHIPGRFEADISGLAIGGAVHARDIVLPSGVVLQADPEAIVVHLMTAPTAAEVEAEVAAAEAELGAGAAAVAEQEAARAEVEGEAPSGEATGQGDRAADTAAREGRPAESQTPQE